MVKHTYTIESFPQEILENICFFLSEDPVEPRRESLYSFSWASKICYTASKRERFKRVRLYGNERRQLGSLTRRLDATFGEDGLRHVQKLKVVGRMPCSEEDEERNMGFFRRKDHKARTTVNWLQPAKEMNFNPEFDSFCMVPTMEDAAFNHVEYPLTDQQKLYLETSMAPLINLLPRLTGLRDFVWNNDTQLPLCLLSALERKYPKLRLHVGKFSLRSLYVHRYQQYYIDPEEFALAKSPLLYSVSLRYNNALIHDRVGLNLEALLDMVSGFSPNLKHVWIHEGSYIVMTPAVFHGGPEEGAIWRGFPEQNNDKIQSTEYQATSQRRLEGLYLTAPGSDDIDNWSRVVHFPSLRSFSAVGAFEESAVEVLAKLAATEGLDSLRSLRLGEVSCARDDLGEMPAMLRLIELLPPLTHLELTGDVHKIYLRSIAPRYSSTLRKLIFMPDKYYCAPGSRKDRFSVTIEDIELLSRHCAKLEELGLYLQRTQGDSTEVQLYKSLGRFHQLRRLHLLLDCTHHPAKEFGQHGEGISEEQHRKDMIFRLRTRLFNAAVDTPLARSIFNAILSTRDATNQKEITLELETYVDELLGDDGMGETMDAFLCSRPRKWILKKSPWFGYITFRGLWDDKPRDFKSLGSFDGLWLGNQSTRGDGIFAEAWESLWPGTKITWLESWSSFPLELEN